MKYEHILFQLTNAVGNLQKTSDHIIQILFDCLLTHDTSICIAAGIALGEICTTSRIDEINSDNNASIPNRLKKILHSPNYHPNIRISAAFGLAEMGISNEMVFEACVQATYFPASLISRYAARALSKIDAGYISIHVIITVLLSNGESQFFRWLANLIIKFANRTSENAALAFVYIYHLLIFTQEKGPSEANPYILGRLLLILTENTNTLPLHSQHIDEGKVKSILKFSNIPRNVAEIWKLETAAVSNKNGDDQLQSNNFTDVLEKSLSLMLSTFYAFGTEKIIKEGLLSLTEPDLTQPIISLYLMRTLGALGKSINNITDQKLVTKFYSLLNHKEWWVSYFTAETLLKLGHFEDIVITSLLDALDKRD